MRILKHLAGLLVLGLPAAQAWDFTPREERLYADEPVPSHYSIVNQDRKIVFAIDLWTKVAGTATGAEFTFKELKTARIGISQSPFQQTRPPFDKKLPAYLEAAKRLLPPGSSDVVLDWEKANPYAINNWTSHQAVYHYTLNAQRLSTSITFLNYSAAEQWVVSITSDRTEFEKACRRASDILNTFVEKDLDYRLEDVLN